MDIQGSTQISFVGEFYNRTDILFKVFKNIISIQLVNMFGINLAVQNVIYVSLERLCQITHGHLERSCYFSWWLKIPPLQ